MSEHHPHNPRASVPRRWLAPVLAVGLIGAAATTVVVALSRKSSAPEINSAVAQPKDATLAAPPTARLRTNGRVKALDFSVAATPANPNPASSRTTTTPVTPLAVGSPVRADSPAAAVTSLVNAAIAGDLDTAWSLVSTADQARLGYKQRIAEQANASGWKGFSVTSAVGDSVVGTLTQTPKVSDIDGVVAAQGNLSVRTIKEGSVYRVLWSRKSIMQEYPEQSAAQDDAVSSAVGAWIRSRQACDAAPAHEFSSGLIGVVGLANRLCRTNGKPVLDVVSDLEALDEPQPIIEAFGGTALQWARVVSIAAPVPMEVVVAPRGTEWIVIAVARPTITKS